MSIQVFRSLALLLFCIFLISPKMGVTASGHNLSASYFGLEKSHETFEQSDQKRSTWRRIMHHMNPKSEDNLLKKALIWGIVTVLCYALGYLILVVIGIEIASVLGIIGSILWGGGSVTFLLAIKNLLFWMIEKGWFDWWPSHLF
ncbi:MAG: hypothetical protein SF052_03180 [Bacteroidia bacterium]|nr:hypothetical protein [Bacteroidia bacterium]